MGSTELQKKIIELRILLQSICDGFSLKDFNKKSNLTMRTKVLFVISRNQACPPSVLIDSLGIAKSNLALLCKSLSDEGVITGTKGDIDKRNVYYNITPKGEAELDNFFKTMADEEVKLSPRELKTMEKKFDDIIEFINKKYKD